MRRHADVVVLQHPRGTTALVWFDLSTGVIVTTHAKLRDKLRRGLRDWAGRVVHTQDGGVFLSAVYDHFFLKGYGVRWFSASGLTCVQSAYRV